jgi:hypothetical protein
VPDVIATLSEQTGIGQDQIRKALGSLLTALKAHLPADVFDHLKGAVPQADALIGGAPEPEPSSGGLVGAVAGLAGKVFGGKGLDPASLLDRFSKSGLSLEQVQAFLPKVVEFLESKLPPEVAELIKSHLSALPAPEGAKP